MPQSKPCKQMLDPPTDSISVLTPSLNLKHNAEKLFPICATGVLNREVEKKMKSCENASAPQQDEEWKQAGRGFLLLCVYKYNVPARRRFAPMHPLNGRSIVISSVTRLHPNHNPECQWCRRSRPHYVAPSSACRRTAKHFSQFSSARWGRT